MYIVCFLFNYLLALYVFWGVGFCYLFIFVFSGGGSEGGGALIELKSNQFLANQLNQLINEKPQP